MTTCPRGGATRVFLCSECLMRSHHLDNLYLTEHSAVKKIASYPACCWCFSTQFYQVTTVWSLFKLLNPLSQRDLWWSIKDPQQEPSLYLRSAGDKMSIFKYFINCHLSTLTQCHLFNFTSNVLPSGLLSRIYWQPWIQLWTLQFWIGLLGHVNYAIQMYISIARSALRWQCNEKWEIFSKYVYFDYLLASFDNRWRCLKKF